MIWCISGIIVIVLIILFIEFKIHYSKRSITNDLSEELNSKIDLCSQFIEYLKQAQISSFGELIQIHKDVWIRGIQPRSIDCTEHGKFRAEDVMHLDITNIYLGNIHDFEVHNIQYWQDYKDPIGENPYGLNAKLSPCDIMWLQYKNTLLGSIGSYRQELIIEKREII